MILLDESGEDREGKKTVGAARQYSGRASKVDMGQMGVFVALVKGSFWTLLDGELYVPERWFGSDYAEQRQQAGLPKYRAWQHHLALTILAAWFIAETKLDWVIAFARDSALLTQYEVEVLPTLSVANVRILLRSSLPLPQLSTEQASALVVKHLVNRTRSRRSRLNKRPAT